MGASYLDEARLLRSIAAVATAPGTGAIGIVRVSGPDAIKIGARIFSRPDNLLGAPSHTMHLGSVVTEPGGSLDSVLVSIMRAPRTYTGEDLVEFNTHGGNVQVRAVLRACLEAGALPALPGEFTFRAFYNGKIDLTQAESVADLISAATETASRAALARTDGALRQRLEQLRERLISLRARCEASIDFVDEGVPELEHDFLVAEITNLRGSVCGLLDTYERGRLLREGARVTLSGPPNAGKSSLFNALLRDERAIVTEVPGTTRDALTEMMDLDGLPVILADTAGMRSTSDNVEQAGMRFAERYTSSADLVLCVRDATELVEHPFGQEAGDTPYLLIINKLDLLNREQSMTLASTYEGAILVSAKTGEGIDRLSSVMRESLIGGPLEATEPGISRQRHRDGLSSCRMALERARENIDSSEPIEVIALDLREACSAVEGLLGRVLDDDVIDHIFGEFCIGK